MQNSESRSVCLTDLAYQPLSTPTSTCVFTLQPGVRDNPIYLSLEEIDLDDKPHLEYEAISYTWGPPGQEKLIRIEGHEDVHIRANLWNFIRRLRSERKPRTLWADAICISQSDPVEKGKQVEIIGRIFQQAERVLVWVGEHSDGSDQIPDTYHIHPDPPPMTTLDVFLIWDAFWGREYWSRRWIVQELILARETLVHCGDTYLGSLEGVYRQSNACLWHRVENPSSAHVWSVGDGDHHKLIYSMLDDPGSKRVTENCRYVHAIIEIRRHHSFGRRYKHFPPEGSKPLTRPTDETTWSIIDIFRGTKCQDPRDSIYALLSLVGLRGIPSGLRPDYTIEPHHVFFQACISKCASYHTTQGLLLEVAAIQDLLSGLTPTTLLLIQLLELLISNHSSVPSHASYATFLAIAENEFYRHISAIHDTFSWRTSTMVEFYDDYIYEERAHDAPSQARFHTFPISLWYQRRGPYSFNIAHGTALLNLLVAKHQHNTSFIEEWSNMHPCYGKWNALKLPPGKDFFWNRWRSLCCALAGDESAVAEIDERKRGLAGLPTDAPVPLKSRREIAEPLGLNAIKRRVTQFQTRTASGGSSDWR